MEHGPRRARADIPASTAAEALCTWGRRLSGRRTPPARGLRREEVAPLWRDVSRLLNPPGAIRRPEPSEQMLASALDLAPAADTRQATYLFQMAGHNPPAPPAGRHALRSPRPAALLEPAGGPPALILSAWARRSSHRTGGRRSVRRLLRLPGPSPYNAAGSTRCSPTPRSGWSNYPEDDRDGRAAPRSRTLRAAYGRWALHRRGVELVRRWQKASPGVSLPAVGTVTRSRNCFEDHKILSIRDRPDELDFQVLFTRRPSANESPFLFCFSPVSAPSPAGLHPFLAMISPLQFCSRSSPRALRQGVAELSAGPWPPASAVQDMPRTSRGVPAGP